MRGSRNYRKYASPPPPHGKLNYPSDTPPPPGIIISGSAHG